MSEDIQDRLPGEITAEALIAEIEAYDLAPLRFTQMLDSLPFYLKTVLEIVLDGIDYEAEKSTPRAVAARMLAIFIANLKPFTRPEEEESAA